MWNMDITIFNGQPPGEAYFWLSHINTLKKQQVLSPPVKAGDGSDLTE